MAEKKSRKCVDCAKPIGRRATRCVSCAAKTKWKQNRNYGTPEHRHRLSVSMKMAWERGDFDSPEYRKKLSQATKEKCQDTEYLSNRSEALKRTLSNPQQRHLRSEITKALWQDPEYRQGHSEGMKALWQDPQFRHKVIKIMQSPEYRQKQAQKTRERLEQHTFGVLNEETRHKISVAQKARWEQGVYDGIFQGPTSIELAMSIALDTLGIEHISQYRPNGYSRIYDEYIFPDILLEIHGDYWHGNPMFFSDDELNDKQRNHRKSDPEKVAWANENGYNLVIIWEYEIKLYGAQLLCAERILPLLEGKCNK